MRLLPALLAASLASVGCAVAPPPQAPPPPPNVHSPFTGFASDHYRDPASWLCLPGRSDACSADLDATDLRPDGSRVEVHDRPPPVDDVDCFYVYPTVDLRPWPASHTDFSDLGPMTRTAIAQIARFRTACRVFAPLYRQTTIGTYLQGDVARLPYREVAVSDVVDAFLHYMGQYNGGRKIVLVGHSQGGEMLVALIRRIFDRDPVMREKLLLAMPIGWPLWVPPGKTTGGTFENVPVCTERGQTGCVVAYRTYADGEKINVGRALPPPGSETVCVSPSELAHGTPVLSRAYFTPPPSPFKLVGMDGMQTPFVLVRDFYQARCADDANGVRYLAVSVARKPGDVRQSPIDLGHPILHGILGYHALDLQFAQGDLVDLVAERAAALRAQKSQPGSAQTATP